MRATRGGLALAALVPRKRANCVRGAILAVVLGVPAAASAASGSSAIDEPRHYTANAGATNEMRALTLRAVAGLSNEGNEDSTGPVNHAPVCDDVAVSVEAGKSVKVPFARCTDADGDDFQVVIEGEPAHGIFDYGTQQYTAAAGYSGEDLMRFRAMDARGAASELGSIRITVTPATNPTPDPTPGPTQPPLDVTAPSLRLLAPSSLTVRTALRRDLRIRATTNEVGHLVVRAFVTRRTARRLKIAKNAKGAVAVASLKRQVATGSTALRVKLSRRARRRLKSGTRVNLRIVGKITDSAGNARTRTRRIKLK